MPSNSLVQWRGPRSAALDEIEQAHASIGGTARGRRYATQQINRAYAVLLSSEFQGFCRDLYTECADFIVAAAPASLRVVIRAQFVWGPLGRGNPQAAILGSDFGRFGLPFWDRVSSVHAQNDRRKELLDELMEWRNAIAHNDFDPARFGSNPVLLLHQVRAWRSALNILAQSFDVAMRTRLTGILGPAPWLP